MPFSVGDHCPCHVGVDARVGHHQSVTMYHFLKNRNKRMKEKTPLTFQEAVQLAASRFFEFTGRSRRSEYWWVALIAYVIVAIAPAVLSLVDLLIFPLTFRRLHDTGRSGWWYGVFLIFQYLSGIVIVMVLGASILLAFASPWSLLSAFPVLFLWPILLLLFRLVLIVFLCQDSDPCENQYGVSPKYGVE